MSRKASVSSVSSTTCAASVPATIAQKRQATGRPYRDVGTIPHRRARERFHGVSDPSLRRTADIRVAGGARSRGVAVTESATVVAARAHRTYVLDTSVLLADPRALVRFDEHEVVIPIVVLME